MSIADGIIIPVGEYRGENRYKREPGQIEPSMKMLTRRIRRKGLPERFLVSDTEISFSGYVTPYYWCGSPPFPEKARMLRIMHDSVWKTCGAIDRDTKLYVARVTIVHEHGYMDYREHEEDLYRHVIPFVYHFEEPYRFTINEIEELLKRETKSEDIEPAIRLFFESSGYRMFKAENNALS